MIETTQAYKDAIKNHEQQHIFGMLNFKSAGEMYLSDENLVGEPTYSRQCTKVENEFGIGQLYTGTASITVRLPERYDGYYALLRGGSFHLQFRAGQSKATENSDWLHLGRWIITDAKRGVSGEITLSGVDCISRLNVAINDNWVGSVSLASRMAKVTELTGVKFAQTADQIIDLSGIAKPLWSGTSYAATCRDEVIAIAQLLGGFAADDRYGQIIFKKFGNKSVAEIEASDRHSISLSEYSFGLRAVAYDNGYGHTTYVPIGGEKPELNTAVTVTLSGNPYMNLNPNNSESQMDRDARIYLEPIARNLDIPDRNPGEVQIYGDPSLELGDMITLRSKDGNPVNFLITAEHWQFRGPHVLVSAGAAENVLAGTAEATRDKSQQIVTVINTTKTINTVDLKSYGGTLTDVLRTVAEGGFSCREETVVFAEFTANIRGLGASDVRLNALYDGVKQTVHAIDRTEENGSLTVHFSVSINASSGTHTVSAEACGNADIERITGIVWGQGIVGEQAVPTNADDYEYTVSDRRTTITKYIGSSKKPSVPSTLGGADVKIIGEEAFSGSQVEFVYIPEGVEKIL